MGHFCVWLTLNISSWSPLPPLSFSSGELPLLSSLTSHYSVVLGEGLARTPGVKTHLAQLACQTSRQVYQPDCSSSPPSLLHAVTWNSRSACCLIETHSNTRTHTHNHKSISGRPTLIESAYYNIKHVSY